MIQSIYAAVSNGNQVHCGKRIPKYQAQPIPLMKSNYLGEFRTQLEKAKARRNLGIGDEYTLTWGNITGRIEDNTNLVEFIENQWKYEYVSPHIQQEIKNVKQALDYALYYISTYEANDQAVQNLSQQFDILTQHVDGIKQQLQQDINSNSQSIEQIEQSINQINQSISDINDSLQNINVDKNIHDWVEQNLGQSKTIYFKDIVETHTETNSETGEETTVEEVVLQIIEVKISQSERNALIVKDDGLYVKDFSLDIDDIKQHQEQVDESLVDLKYNTDLPNETTSPVHEGITVEQLKNKSLSEIVDEVLFPAEVRELVEPTIEYNDIKTLVEINTPVYYPQVEYLAGDAGETIVSTNNLTFNGIEYNEDYYNSVGTYIFTAITQYDAGNYLKNNRGETTDFRIEAGAVSTTKSVKVTYPWYAGNTEEGVTKQVLVPINEVSGIIDFSLGKHAVIKIPGSRSVISSFRLDSGLGYLDVDMNGWTYSTETINGIPYKVWTKQDSYAAILPHRINFTIVI